LKLGEGDWQTPFSAGIRAATHHSELVLPRALADLASELDTAGHGPRRRLEAVAYLIVSLVTLVALIRLWT
jgi:hypothetical protein